MMIVFRRRLGYDKEKLAMKKIRDKIDKAYRCPDCNVMTGNVREEGNKYISVCDRCGLIWETRSI